MAGADDDDTSRDAPALQRAPHLREQIEEALRDMAAGRVDLIPHEAVKRKLAARRLPTTG